ncbi:hypothetical protein BW732_07085 [Vagococcus penaei]|uniref:HTH merR-type domain-containing protein n=1 Tax=Vagococcus penaei TaxID=633807 RepID=A0A1Q2D6N6_9ENTE|nr:MerR family transcriptional regulator [Vagococcus penaei]AQP53997.1 hypothetical protein BW732_07085 [Vagococcus penaei]
MYTIGTFSKLADISIKTLRYYHEIDLISPSYIDPKTNYRYYGFNKFSEIEKIKLFKSFGVSLDEIKELIVTDSNSMTNILVEQQKKLTEWNGNTFFDKYYKVSKHWYCYPITLDHEPLKL